MNLHTLTVQVPAFLGRLLVAQSLPRFIRMHAGLRIQMCAASSSGPTLARGADAAVCIGPIAASDLIVRHIGVVHAVTCASPELIERHGSPDSPADLAPNACIALLDPHTHRAQEWQFRRGRAAYVISPAAHLAFSDSECAVAAAARGGGFVRVLSIEAEQQIAAGLLRPVLDDWNEECLPVAIVHSQDPAARDGIAAFGAFVAGLLPTESRLRGRVTTGNRVDIAATHPE
jgi:LysR family transcriptional regulator, regulator for bpeEF and oprC